MRGSWGASPQSFFKLLKRFLLFLWGHHVLIQTDNTTMVAYINCQGGFLLLLITLASDATHVPGDLNILGRHGLQGHADIRVMDPTSIFGAGGAEKPTF